MVDWNYDFNFVFRMFYYDLGGAVVDKKMKMSMDKDT